MKGKKVATDIFFVRGHLILIDPEDKEKKQEKREIDIHLFDVHTKEEAVIAFEQYKKGIKSIDGVLEVNIFLLEAETVIDSVSYENSREAAA